MYLASVGNGVGNAQKIGCRNSLVARLVGFLDRCSMFIPGHYGFEAGHSTAMAILDDFGGVAG